MNVLKNISVAILCFLLFLALAVFGIAYTINSTALNPGFIANEIDRIPVSDIVREYVEIESPPEMPELEETVFSIIENIEPVVKQRLSDTIQAFYEYFPDDIQNLELNILLRENFLTSDLIVSIIDNIDIAELAGLILTEDFIGEIPVEIENFDEYVEDAIIAAEPAIRAQIVEVADPVFDYILGIRQTLDVSISLDEVKDSLMQSVRQSLLDSPPPELAFIPRSMRAQLFDAFYDEIAGFIPSTFDIDESVISADLPRDMQEAFTETKEVMEEVAIYVSLFQTVYIWLIVFMAVLVVLIIVILRDVRKITRRLGIPLITYGAIEYAGVWVTRLVSRGQIQLPEIMPEFFEDWVYQLTEDVLKPVEIFSLVLLIVGIVLVIISYVYKRGEQAETI